LHFRSTCFTYWLTSGNGKSRSGEKLSVVYVSCISFDVLFNNLILVLYIKARMAKVNESTSDNGAVVGDEQWIVNQANSYRNSDVYAAKSWLIVGRSLFPRNFQIQVLSFVSMTSSNNSG